MMRRNRFFWARLAGLALFGLFGLFGLLAPGCAGNVRVVDIDSKPSGASIYVNGEKKGVTRNEKVQIQFNDATQRVLIQLVKPRFKPVLQYWMLEEVPEKRIFQLEDDT